MLLKQLDSGKKYHANKVADLNTLYIILEHSERLQNIAGL